MTSKPIVENVTVGRSSLNKGIYLFFVLVCIAAFMMALQKQAAIILIAVTGLLVFGIGYWYVATFKIVVEQDGFTVTHLFRSTTILWKDITALNYQMAYNGHAVQLMLYIFYTAGKRINFSVNQFNKPQMQRFFELLHEQCITAVKNDHFVTKASGEKVRWKDKLSLF